MLRIAVFASGKGSNLRAILDAIQEKRIRGANVVAVISNNSDAGALGIAREHGIRAVHISRKMFGSDEEFDRELFSVLADAETNFIVLAGYMKKINPAIVRAYRNRIVNIHPALLPAFGGSGMYGARVHEAVLASGAKYSGATVHIVDEAYDHGPIVLQQQVEIAPGETPETLAARIHEVEHTIYPEALRLFAEGKVTINAHNEVRIAS